MTDDVTNLADTMREGMRRLASGVCVISSVVDGHRYAMTATSVTSVSDSPASLLVCINQEAALQRWMTPGREFVVNVLHRNQETVSNLCASKGEQERFSEGDWQENNNDLPYLGDALANFFCRVDNEPYIYGTHQIVIGRLDSVTIQRGEINPLIYLDGSYHGI